MSNLKPKKIALVGNTSWGIFNFRLGLIRTLLRQDCEVYVIAPRDSYSDKLIAEGVYYHHLPLDNFSTNPLKDIKVSFALFRIYKKEKFDCIFHYTIKPIIYGSIVARLANCRSIAVTTGLGKMFRFDSVITQALISNLYRLAASCASQVWFLNEADQRRMIAAKIVKKDKAFLLSSEGINTEKFRPSRKEKKGNVFRFLFAGRLLREKGVYDYVAAAQLIKRKYKDVRFELLGFIDPHNPDSVSLTDIESWQRDGVINYLGSTEDVRPYIDRVDCVVLPSFYQEGISRILLEAASMATPMITSDQPGCAEVVIQDRTGIVVPAHDLMRLEAAMTKLLKMDPEDLDIWGEIARKYVKSKYEEKIIIQQYLDVIEISSKPSKVNTTMK